MTEDEHNALIDQLEESSPLLLSIFARALGYRLKDREGIVVHIYTEDESDYIACLVMRSDEDGMVKILPDVMYRDYDDGQLVWVHSSQEDAEVANEKMKKTELH